jgi:hypothetical protein
LFSWSTWLLIVLIIILIFWLFYGGKHEYEFVGVKPLSTKSLFQNLEHIPTREREYHFEAPKLHNMPTNFMSNIVEEPKIKSCKGEDIMAEILEHILESKVHRNVRPNFLRNPETGKNLELDCYNEEYAIAVEYNGIQHYKFPSAFHKTEKDFYDQIYRDKLKKKLCDETGVYLIVVPYWVDTYGSEDGHLEHKGNNKKPLFVPREVKYKRIYDYLFEKINEYFQIIFPDEEKEENEEDLDFEEDDYPTDTGDRWSEYNFD